MMFLNILKRLNRSTGKLNTVGYMRETQDNNRYITFEFKIKTLRATKDQSVMRDIRLLIIRELMQKDYILKKKLDKLR